MKFFTVGKGRQGNLFRSLSIIWIAVLGVVSAHAQPPKMQGVFTELTPPEMGGLLQGMGFEVTETTSDKLVSFRFQLNGYKVWLFHDSNNIRLSIKFSDKLDPLKANEWNRRYRYAKAYSDEDGGACLEADLDFDGGVTKRTVEEFIKTFRSILDTWVEFVAKDAPATVSARRGGLPLPHVKSPSAKNRIKTPQGEFSLWLDGTKWKQGTSEGNILTFQHRNGDGYAKVITERLGIPLDTLKPIVLANAKKVDPKAKFILEEMRVVNGKPILALQIQGTLSGVPYRYYGYYYGGTSGTIQVITYSGENLFAEYSEDFTEFLDGLETHDKELPPSSSDLAPKNDATILTADNGLLLFNSAKMSLKYDPKKWKLTPSNEPGRFSFTHVNGDGYAAIIAERIEIPTDSLPDVALTNAQSEDSKARITYREKRSINGAEVWFLKLEAESSKIPLTYYGYYYGGAPGTVQAVTYTGKSLIAEYDTDFMEFLNGLRPTTK